MSSISDSNDNFIITLFVIGYWGGHSHNKVVSMLVKASQNWTLKGVYIDIKFHPILLNGARH